MSEPIELLFFDTFAHDNTEEINLDLVQFPKPVYVTEVRIIPLGARVQADFPGGVRLGATNPSQFRIEFFVNDLGKPGASTFESLGGFDYDQNGCINLNCNSEETVRKIPTDGLVLRGWYTTITLAVYGTLTNNITEQILQPVTNPSLNQPNTIADAQLIISTAAIEPEWQQENIQNVPIDYNTNTPATYQAYPQTEQYPAEFNEYYNDIPKDPRSYHHTSETEWDSKSRSRTNDSERERDRSRDYQKSSNVDREHSRIEIERRDRERDRDREKRYSRSQSRDRDRQSREYREMGRDKEHDRDWEGEYRDRGDHDWDRERDRGHDRDRDRSYKHEDSYRRSYTREEREERKRPRTPPTQSPKRPHTPQTDHKDPPVVERESDVVPEEESERTRREQDEASKDVKEVRTPPTEENTQMDVEEFEPILSDEDILDDSEQYQDIDYDYSTYTNNDDIIKLFTPGVTKLNKYIAPKSFQVDNDKIDIEESLSTTIGIADDYFKSSITKYVLDRFSKLNTELKEEFIHLCEKLISTIGSHNSFCDIMRLYEATNALNLHNFSETDKELVQQVQVIIKTIVDWLQIALNFEMANSQEQPAYKIRHIKCGVRLAEWCSHSDEFLQYLWEHNFNIQKELINLYNQEFMALSIKLMILKALDTSLSHKFSVEKFLMGEHEHSPKENGYHNMIPVSESSGYRILIKHLQSNPLVRLKFALNSILKKMNLYEILHKMHCIISKIRNITNDISAEDINLITKILDQILQYYHNGPFVLSQPKRFLPVSSQFEIIRTESDNILINYFKMFNLLECFLFLLVHPNTLNLPAIKTPIFEVLSLMLQSSHGLEYLSSKHETINVLLKCLLKSDEELQYTLAEPSFESKSHYLGLNIAYKLQALYHIECLSHIGKKYGLDCDSPEILDELHGLLCLTFSPVGKICCSSVLGMDDNIRSLLQFLDILHNKEKLDNYLPRLKKSSGVAYIVDLVSIAIISTSNIKLMEKFSKTILNIVNQQDLFEDNISAKLNEIRLYLSPFENINTVSYENISPYLDNIEKLIENVTFYPGSLITSLRVIEYLGISKFTNKCPIISENNPNNYIELKYKHVILQLYSLDGTTILTKLLQKISEHYEQPSLFTAIFASGHGSQIINIVQPCIKLLKEMLSYVIQCQNMNFKDLTAIPILLQTYNLLNSFPATAAGYLAAQEVKTEIINTLLVYTQPFSDQVLEKDSLNKSLWTQMCGEIIKFITSAPYNFVSGLLVFSEMLPLPLPIQTGDDLTTDEISWSINLRKLWSAHLHLHSNSIQEMIQRLCISTQPQLLNLLRRICAQIADLAANSATMIARGILDIVYEALIPKEDMKMGPCNSHVARVLNFLACLVTHNTIKCAILHLIHTNSCVTSKPDDKYTALIPAFAQVLKNNCNTNSHIQAQECIISVIQSFCDIELTLLQCENSPDVCLANALPIKEHLVTYVTMLLDHLSADNSFVTYLPLVRTLLLLTEHDYGLFHLREQALKRNDLFLTILTKLANNFSISNAECLSTLSTLLEFLRICIVIEDENVSSGYSPRTIKFTPDEIKSLIGWNSSSEEQPSNHPLLMLTDILKKSTEDDNSFETLLDSVETIIKLIESSQMETSKESYTEVVLPIPDTLLSQFCKRTIFSSTEACDERLTARFWLAAPSDEVETGLENVTCDLLEICRQHLPTDYNIIKEIEKLCRVSRIGNDEDKEKLADDQKRKLKKPLVPPVRARGFTRAVQQRPDLFRSRPPNTSRPPSLHVDDFVALETCGAQPTGPTGYNKISRELLASSRLSRVSRGRSFANSERSVQYRQMIRKKWQHK
ncbi:protein virilizer isoform X2 [Aethina tumida]|uniref:protein virilizer isoform X2 n=1 Tax=Aethina tumida TaxID=116153 RepID=UPI0021495B20|nr:protein virilizer isoform X2 [Aethina tumida]